MSGSNDAGIGEIVWEADAARKAGSALWRFAEATGHAHGADPSDYAALLDWSIREPAAFRKNSAKLSAKNPRISRILFSAAGGSQRTRVD